MSHAKDEIEKKDALIEYQLGIVDKLINQIEQKEKEDFENNPEDDIYFENEYQQSEGNAAEFHSLADTPD